MCNCSLELVYEYTGVYASRRSGVRTKSVLFRTRLVPQAAIKFMRRIFRRRRRVTVKHPTPYLAQISKGRLVNDEKCPCGQPRRTSLPLVPVHPSQIESAPFSQSASF